MSDPVIQQIQAYLQAKKPLGIGYPLAADGVVTDQLVSILGYLQSSLGSKISLVSGKKVNPNAITLIEKALGTHTTELLGAMPKAQPKIEEPKKEEEIPEDLLPDPSLKKWESFLSQSLPLVGKVYDGDLASAAKKIEAKISSEINKPMTGMIWSDEKKKFNTTPDDVLAALSRIEEHKKTSVKSAKIDRDTRFIRLSDIARENDLQKTQK